MVVFFFTSSCCFPASKAYVQFELLQLILQGKSQLKSIETDRTVMLEAGEGGGVRVPWGLSFWFAR